MTFLICINDADNHFNEPPECFENYIDPSKIDLAIRSVVTPDGRDLQLFAGKPSKFLESEAARAGTGFVYSQDQLDTMLGGTAGLRQAQSGTSEAQGNLQRIPGMLLNRLNPLKGLSDDERKAFVAEFREKSEAFGNRDLRLALMDEQGIDKAIMYPAAAHDIEYEFVDNIDALYANIRAFNRWMHEEVGYVVENRMWMPPYISFADPDLAVKELETVIADGAPMIQTKSGHAHGGRDNPFGGRSLADPIYDRFWSIANEAGIRLAVHLGGTDYQKYGADWSEDPNQVLGDFDAFQWMMYWGDRPAMELTAGADPAQLLRALSEHASGALRAGHRLAALHPAQDGPRLHAGPQSQVGRERPPRSPPLADLPRPLRGGPLPRRERHPGRRRSGHRTHRVRLGLPPRRRPRLPLQIRRLPALLILRRRPAPHHARQPRNFLTTT